MLLTLATLLQPQSDWVPVVILILIAATFAVSTVVMSNLIGPGRTGKVKETIYESGMAPMQDTRRRFNARFYIVAMIFVVFDVAIVFFYPWATVFTKAGGELKAMLLGQMLLFSVVILSAYIYAWGKGAFRWD
jgi:NADH-quinone oxidoreductase subunit A